MTSSTETTLAVPSVAAILGYAGVIPFAGLALGLWVLPTEYSGELHQALILYAAIILSFMGAVHWGLAMGEVGVLARNRYLFSVLQPLVAWLSALLPPVVNYLVLIVAFTLLCVFDVFLSRQGEIPSWYPSLRLPVTSLVVLSLVMSAWAMA